MAGTSKQRTIRRRNYPESYLRDTYNNMNSRTKGHRPNRPNYVGLSICKREEFINAFKNDCQFIKIYKLWQESGFKRGSAPSIDRINDEYGYELWNMQFLTNIENCRKRKNYMKPVIYDGVKYNSITELSKSLNLKTNYVHRQLNSYKELNGKELTYA